MGWAVFESFRFVCCRWIPLFSWAITSSKSSNDVHLGDPQVSSVHHTVLYQFWHVLGHDLAGRVSAQAGFILYSKTMSAPMLHIAMISQKELAMALYENQTFVSWSPLLSCFIGSMNANESLHHHSNLHDITSSWLLYMRQSIMIIIGGSEWFNT